ncbi:MAG: hypothetical protein LBK04_06005 [Clostridiales Family XIII bacterium]|jgi:uncharacterized alkaline shock family protein YloU|nr:hypothetical protein [Clostridiales Family XIII bacterium]
MAYKIKNDIGSIELNRRVIENVCGRTVDTFGGQLIVSDPRGRLKKNPIQSAVFEDGFVRGRYNGELLDIELYLIIQFGISMKNIATKLVSALREDIPSATGIDVGVVTIVFVGTLADKLTRRSIEFKYERPS